MSASIPELHVVHALPGRARLRVPEKRGDDRFFHDLCELLLRLDRVREVRASARTGSFLLLHEGELGSLLRKLAASNKVRVVELAPQGPMRRIKLAIEQADDQIAQRTRGAFSLGSVTFVGMLVAGMYQTQRGHFFPAGMTLLKYALNAMEREAERESIGTRV